MRVAKGMARLTVWIVLVFFTGNGLGYVFRTYECRSDRVRIYVAAPGYELEQGIPAKLYGMQVTRCTLPKQWGGEREPLEGYP